VRWNITGPGVVSTAALFIMASVSTAQTPLPVGPEFQVNSHTTGGQVYGVPAVAPDGTFVIVWNSGYDDDRGGGIFGQRYDQAGAPFGSEFGVNTYTGVGAYRPDVVFDAQAKFTVVWRDPAGIWRRRYDSSGMPLDAEQFRVNTYPTGTHNDAKIAIDAAGRVVVVWLNLGQDGSGWGVFGQSYDADGLPLGAEFAVNTYTTGTQHHASVASDALGNFMVVWESEFQVGAQRFDYSGVRQGMEFRVNSIQLGGNLDPSVVAEPDGGFFVVWQSQYGGGFEISGRRFDGAGAPLAPQFRVNSYTTGHQWRPAISVDPQGTFAVVWGSSDQDGSSIGVFGQRYDASGNPIGGEFRVNTYTTSHQEFPFVASASGGEFVVSWTSFQQDGDDHGVFAQRFRPDFIFGDGFDQ
jgi:hypothetical protein